MNYTDLYNCKIAVIGLGYVGLPLAMEFAERKICSFSGNKIARKVVGYDRKLSRIRELKENLDKTAEKSSNDLRNKKKLINQDNNLGQWGGAQFLLFTICFCFISK